MMVEFNTILSFIQAAGIIVGVAYYIINIQNNQRNQEIALKNQEHTLRNQQLQLETRQAQLFMDIFQTTTSIEWITVSEELIHLWKWTDFEDYDTKYGDIFNNEATGKLNALLGYWNGVGVLVQRKLIDPDLIYDMKRVPVIELWEKFSPVIMEWRKIYSAPQIYIALEFLVDELKRIRENKNDRTYIRREAE